jgi:hypothetical protein
MERFMEWQLATSKNYLGVVPENNWGDWLAQGETIPLDLQSREFPSWGYKVEQGATTNWDRWDSCTKKDGFGRHTAAMNSFSHYALGTVCEWMYSTLAGIESDGAGYKRILISPSPPATNSNQQHEAIVWVDAHYDSPRGNITVKWNVADRDFHLQVTIPTNTADSRQPRGSKKQVDRLPHRPGWRETYYGFDVLWLA